MPCGGAIASHCQARHRSARYGTASKPLRASRCKSLSDGPLGCLSPCSHLRTVDGLMPSTDASTVWLTCKRSRKARQAS